MAKPVSATRARELRELIGDPEVLAQQLSEFSRAAQALSSDHPRFIEEYPQKWVAVHGDQVVAADSLDDLLEELDEQGVEREHTIIRHIDRTERALFL